MYSGRPLFNIIYHKLHNFQSSPGSSLDRWGGGGGVTMPYTPRCIGKLPAVIALCAFDIIYLKRGLEIIYTNQMPLSFVISNYGGEGGMKFL